MNTAMALSILTETGPSDTGSANDRQQWCCVGIFFREYLYSTIFLRMEDFLWTLKLL
jgi:hypothetical protein